MTTDRPTWVLRKGPSAKTSLLGNSSWHWSSLLFTLAHFVQGGVVETSVSRSPSCTKSSFPLISQVPTSVTPLAALRPTCLSLWRRLRDGTILRASTQLVSWSVVFVISCIRGWLVLLRGLLQGPLSSGQTRREWDCQRYSPYPETLC